MQNKCSTAEVKGPPSKGRPLIHDRQNLSLQIDLSGECRKPRRFATRFDLYNTTKVRSILASCSLVSMPAGDEHRSINQHKFHISTLQTDRTGENTEPMPNRSWGDTGAPATPKWGPRPPSCIPLEGGALLPDPTS